MSGGYIDAVRICKNEPVAEPLDDGVVIAGHDPVGDLRSF